MTRSGVSERAAASAANGQVKNLAEKPLICNMAATLDAIAASSSTPKMQDPGSPALPNSAIRRRIVANRFSLELKS